MVINLSDVLSEQHKPIDVTVSFELEEIRMKSGVFPIVEKDPVHVRNWRFRQRHVCQP